MHQIYVRQAIEAGIAASKAGRTVSVGEVRKRFDLPKFAEVKVHWTDVAVEHLLAIHGFIAKDSPEYALRVVGRLTRRSQHSSRRPPWSQT